MEHSWADGWGGGTGSKGCAWICVCLCLIKVSERDLVRTNATMQCVWEALQLQQRGYSPVTDESTRQWSSLNPDKNRITSIHFLRSCLTPLHPSVPTFPGGVSTAQTLRVSSSHIWPEETPPLLKPRARVL